MLESILLRRAFPLATTTRVVWVSGYMTVSGRSASCLHEWEDDEAFNRGVGFTDIVKRPTTSASMVSAAEFDYGTEMLHSKLRLWSPPLLVFAFKGAATRLYGSFQGNGFVSSLRVGTSDVYVMPGPYEPRISADVVLNSLRGWLVEHPP